jgi:arylsulfate sulfotransferase
LGKDWSIHHDYTYDEENNCLDILATKNNTGVIEDCIIKLDLTSGKVTQLIDFKDYMSDIEKKASTLEPDEKKNEEGVDWIHFNTIQLIDNKDLILSSRELSTIIRVNDIYTNPTLKWNLYTCTIYRFAIFSYSK